MNVRDYPWTSPSWSIISPLIARASLSAKVGLPRTWFSGRAAPLLRLSEDKDLNAVLSGCINYAEGSIYVG